MVLCAGICHRAELICTPSNDYFLSTRKFLWGCLVDLRVLSRLIPLHSVRIEN